MGCLSKADLLKPLDLKSVKHPMPLWGEDAYVNLRALSSADLITLQKSFGNGVEDGNSFEFGCNLLVYCLCDDEGKRLFADEAEVKLLLQHSPKLLEELMQAAIKVSGLDPESKKN